jgi:RNA polymerase sigma-70 factor (sigma-E family)
MSADMLAAATMGAEQPCPAALAVVTARPPMLQAVVTARPPVLLETRATTSTMVRTRRRAEVGDDAFALAVDGHHDALRRFAFALCGNLAQSEDAVAEAYAKVWPRWRRGRVGELLPYLRRTVANEVYSRHRRRVVEDREEHRQLQRDADNAFEAQVDEHDVLWGALGGLPLQQRVVVVLRIVEDLGEEQVAEMLGLPVGTVKSRLSRGLATLRRKLEATHA